MLFNSNANVAVTANNGAYGGKITFSVVTYFYRTLSSEHNSKNLM